MRSRNLICARCGQDTQNANQGHYWAYCKVLRTITRFHFCCPDSCEVADASTREEST